MPGTSDVIYLYDGSFEGLLCCVHESVYTHELPVDIQPEEAAQPTLFRQKYIAADEEKAARVYDSIPRKISPDAAALVQCVFLSCMPGKELAILRFLLLGYRRGRQTMYLLSHTAVQPMLAARQNLLNEAHLLKEFLRFSDYDGALAATITPKNYVLPFLKEHFCSRLMNETFLIFDRTHKAAGPQSADHLPGYAGAAARHRRGAALPRPLEAILQDHRHRCTGKPPLPHDALSQKILGKHAGDGG